MEHANFPKNFVRYLKFIHEKGGKTTISELAVQFNVKKPTVVETVKKMQEEGLVMHPPYSPVELTRKGKGLAQELLWRHRVLEVLFSSLGLTVEESCVEAERLEVHASLEAVKRICSFFGHPRKCPCEKDIPAYGGCCKSEKR